MRNTKIQKETENPLKYRLKIILIIIVSVSIFGLLIFVFVKNYIKNKIDNLAKEKKGKLK